MSIAVGSVTTGVVTGITKFGAFVEIETGKTGLVHISEVADAYVKDVNDYLKVSDKVQVKIITIEDNGKIGLSIRQAQPTKPQLSVQDNKSPKQFKNDGVERKFKNDTRESRGHKDKVVSLSFEDKLAKFLKDSDELQQSLKSPLDSRRKRGRSGNDPKSSKDNVYR